MTTAQAQTRRGLWVAVAAFVAWGVMPLFWHLLKAVPSLQIVMHRIVWSAVLVSAWLLWTQGRGWLRSALARPRAAWMLALSGVLISFNWGLYIWSVNAGHVVDASLGYFMNPLVNVLFGVAMLGERMDRVQWTSVILAALGVAWLTWQHGQPPWIAIGLAVSFGLYGLVRKLAAADAVAGHGVECLYLLVPAVAVLLWFESQGGGGFGPGWGMGVSLLLVIGGALTALPLIGFAYALQRVPLSVVGVMQYIAPSLQLLIGVLVFGEPFGMDRAVGFMLIWAGLAIFATHGFVRSRQVVPAA
ncbi:MAG: EamA family transporter RarD [Pseudomonadota bacterium]|nr:EamA family transporter RarD [Pseudomonadota bacterium]